MSSSLVPSLREEYRHTASSRRAYRFISSDDIGPITGVIDFILILTSSVFAAIVYHQLALEGSLHLRQYFGIGSVSAVIFISLVASRNLYRVHSLGYFLGQAKGILLPWLIVVAVCTLILFL